MSLYEWSEEYSVGIPSIDEQHQRIFALAQSMHLALQKGDAQDMAETILFELTAYVQSHFADEEQRMREVSYPGLESHSKIHRQMAVRLNDMLNKMQSGHVRVFEVHRFVVAWVMKHILDTDMDYVPFLRWGPAEEARRQCQ